MLRRWHNWKPAAASNENARLRTMTTHLRPFVTGMLSALAPCTMKLAPRPIVRLKLGLRSIEAFRRR